MFNLYRDQTFDQRNSSTGARWVDAYTCFVVTYMYTILGLTACRPCPLYRPTKGTPLPLCRRTSGYCTTMIPAKPMLLRDTRLQTSDRGTTLGIASFRREPSLKERSHSDPPREAAYVCPAPSHGNSLRHAQADNAVVVDMAHRESPHGVSALPRS